MVHAVLMRETYDLSLSSNKPSFLLKFKMLGNTRLLCITVFHVVDVLSISFLEVGRSTGQVMARRSTYTPRNTC